MYVRGVTRNLPSVGSISDQGYSVEFVKYACIICDLSTRQILGKAVHMDKGGLYCLNAKSLVGAQIFALG